MVPHPPRNARTREGIVGTVAIALLLLSPGAPRALGAQEVGGDGATAAEGQGDLEELVSRAMPSVVTFEVETPSGRRQGSGFVVDSTGRILTNHHIVRDAESVRVKLASGDVYDAVAVLAADERRDIAVLQIAGFHVPALPLGNSDSLRIGAPVVLIGSPLGLDNTVSTGILSGRRRDPEGYQLLQISAPASRGSSGGPVLSATGEVVGIAASQLPSGQNLNFAVPINYARGLLARLDGEPVTVLRPASSAREEKPAPTGAEDAVNGALDFDLEGFGGLVVETEATSEGGTRRWTRITYRLIEAVGDGEPRIERYLESETTGTDASGGRRPLRRERTRTIAWLDGLQPISTRGATTWWGAGGERTAEFDLRFEGERVTGAVSDTTGEARDIDRRVPSGIVPRELGELAFATLAADSLTGRSVELVVLDPWTAEVRHDRFDVIGRVRVDSPDGPQEALRVNVASDLSNVAAYFRAERPRLLLRLEDEETGEVEEVIRVEVRPPAGRR